MAVFIAGLFVYPIKSCRGVAVPEASLDAQGLRHDRRWMVVRHDGVFLTQRDWPRMARIVPQVVVNDTGDEVLLVHAPRMPLLQIPVRDALEAEAVQKKRDVTVWRFIGEAIDEGDEAADWFSDVLGTPCHLVRTPRNFSRRVNPETANPNDRVGFADGYPLLVASLASLSDLNRRLIAQNKPPVLMEQFRPNIVVAAADREKNALVPWEEDGWKTLHVGNGGHETAFRVATPCARCSVTTVDPHTGEAIGPEPLQTLSQFRRDAQGKVLFGMNLIHNIHNEAAEAAVRVGDGVRVTRRLPLEKP